MLTLEQVRALSLEEIILLLNDTIADPYSGYFPYIVENTPDFLDEVAEKFGGAWLVSAIRNGKYDPTDKWAICVEDGTEFRTFSGVNELFYHIIKPEDIVEQYNLVCGE